LGENRLERRKSTLLRQSVGYTFLGKMNTNNYKSSQWSDNLYPFWLFSPKKMGCGNEETKRSVANRAEGDGICNLKNV
jgi:hypothetical protein